jgi:hypothetical protein
VDILQNVPIALDLSHTRKPFLRTLLDLVVFLGLGCATWFLIVLAKDRSYKPVLILYSLEGIWIFYRMFVNTSG